jgi:radical SAM superfamily enzyme YgiQ (UPF0313 family)
MMNHRRRLALVSLDWIRPKDPLMPLGHASILAHAHSQGLQDQITSHNFAVNSPYFEPEKAVEEIVDKLDCAQDENSAVALGAFVWNEQWMQEMLKILKHKYKFKGKVILGGPQVSYVKSGIEQYYPLADAFIRGHGEEALVSWLQGDLSNSKGFHCKNDVDRGESAVASLENLTSPFLSGMIAPQKFLRWETQRGCPFSCTFCQHRQRDSTSKRRHFNQQRVFTEAMWICSNKIIQDVAVLDPVFNSGPNYREVLKALIEGKYSGKLSLQCRAEMVQDDFLDLVERLNQTASVTLEFGLQTAVREEQIIIQRGNNLKKVEDVFRKARLKNINFEVSLIFGLPIQTVESFQRSIDFCKMNQVPKIVAFALMLLRGTELYHQKEKYGFKESHEVGIADPLIENGRQFDQIPHVVSSSSFSVNDWIKMADLSKTL